MLKVAYFGTPLFSADLLEKLINSNLVEVALVVTQPDKPVGREQAISPSPVKLIAQKYNIDVFDQDDLSDLPRTLKQHQIDFGLVFSYGKILKQEVLSAPKFKFPQTNFGFINIHPSLLPKCRGASPIVFPLLLGDKETGVSLTLMDELMDHGPILTQEKLFIVDTDTTQTLITKCTTLAFDMVQPIVKKLTIEQFSNVTIIPQNHSHATFTRTLTREDGYISLDLLHKALHGESLDPSNLPEIYQWYINRNQQSAISNQQSSVDIIDRIFRSLSPWPGLWTTITINGQSKRLILKQLAISNKQLAVSRVQLEGKNEVDFATFNKAYQIF